MFLFLRIAFSHTSPLPFLPASTNRFLSGSANPASFTYSAAVFLLCLLFGLPHPLTWHAGGISVGRRMQAYCPQADALLPLCQLGKVKRALRGSLCWQLHCLSFVSVHAVVPFVLSVGTTRKGSSTQICVCSRQKCCKSEVQHVCCLSYVWRVAFVV